MFQALSIPLQSLDIHILLNVKQQFYGATKGLPWSAKCLDSTLKLQQVLFLASIHLLSRPKNNRVSRPEIHSIHSKISYIQSWSQISSKVEFDFPPPNLPTVQMGPWSLVLLWQLAQIDDGWKFILFASLAVFDIQSITNNYSVKQSTNRCLISRSIHNQSPVNQSQPPVIKSVIGS